MGSNPITEQIITKQIPIIVKRFIYSFIASLPTLLLTIVLLLFAIKSIHLFYGFFFLVLTIIIFVGLFIILKDEFK